MNGEAFCTFNFSFFFVLVCYVSFRLFFPSSNRYLQPLGLFAKDIFDFYCVFVLFFLFSIDVCGRHSSFKASVSPLFFVIRYQSTGLSYYNVKPPFLFTCLHSTRCLHVINVTFLSRFKGLAVLGKETASSGFFLVGTTTNVSCI